MKRTLVAVALAVVFVMALAAPAFAQMNHTAAYEFDGVIDFEKQAGHWCNTGAEVKQTIKGEGVMEKAQTISMVPGKITMDDVNDWVAGAAPLTVTTVWELCAPPKYVYDAGYEVDYVPTLGEMYEGGPTWNPEYVGQTTAGRLNPWTVYDNMERMGADALTNQIWAVQVQADPGFSGNIHQSGVAANGAYSGMESQSKTDWEDENDWSFTDKKTWKLFRNGAETGVGPDFVGSYFTMDQHARTSQGTLKRYIDISSPFNHGYLMEDMSVVGKSEVNETFAMNNLPAGQDVPGLWWDLF